MPRTFLLPDVGPELWPFAVTLSKIVKDVKDGLRAAKEFADAVLEE